MQPMDNSQFTEEQRAEAYRVESMQQMVRQTKALESIRAVVVAFMVLFIIGAVFGIIALLSASSSSGF